MNTEPTYTEDPENLLALVDFEYSNPARPHDWNFAGPWPALLDECRRDAKETGCAGHAFQAADDNTWRVWRLTADQLDQLTA
jgi:hypothetical protein